MARTYDDAITALNTLQSNFQTIDAFKKTGKSKDKYAIPEMIEYVRRLGYEPSDFNRLNLIHIAGTKGKGSTSAFISSILSQYLPSSEQPTLPLKKIGLYTSPHLRFVRERIQIDNIPISEELFAKYFFETWDRLDSAAAAQKTPTDLPSQPVYFRFLTLMALHTYMSEGVDTAVIECGIGGEYDSTNILVQPTVTGITSLGIDHTLMLGDTIESIAWHKAGILKAGAACFSAPQPAKALEVLEKRVQEKGTTLTVVESSSQLERVHLGLAADFQYTNASLAVSIAAAHLKVLGHEITLSPTLPRPFIRALETVRFPGRCETRLDNHSKIKWYIDSGHTVESISLSAAWFTSHLPRASPPPPSNATLSPTSTQIPQILLFNQQTRTPLPLLKAIRSTLSIIGQRFTHVVFCSNRTFQEEGFRPDLKSLNNDSGKVESLEVQERMREGWEGLEAEKEGEGDGMEGVEGVGTGKGEGKDAEVVVKGSIEEAVMWCREIAGKVSENEIAQDVREKVVDSDEARVRVLVTGSVHLVGGFLEVLETEH